LENSGVDGRVILKWTIMKWDGGMDYIDLAQERGRWREACGCGNDNIKMDLQEVGLRNELD
jgi:hypothetical protein